VTWVRDLHVVAIWFTRKTHTGGRQAPDTRSCVWPDLLGRSCLDHRCSGKAYLRTIVPPQVLGTSRSQTSRSRRQPPKRIPARGSAANDVSLLSAWARGEAVGPWRARRWRAVAAAPMSGHRKGLRPVFAGQRPSSEVSGGGLEPAVAWCHEQATCATAQVTGGEVLPVATRSHGLKPEDVPTWEQAIYLGAVKSSPERTESHGGPVTCFIIRSLEGTTSSCFGQLVTIELAVRDQGPVALICAEGRACTPQPTSVIESHCSAESIASFDRVNLLLQTHQRPSRWVLPVIVPSRQPWGRRLRDRYTVAEPLQNDHAASIAPSTIQSRTP
jgi:hypothetical protein